MRRACLTPRCPHPPTYRGRCRIHAAKRERATHANKAIYNSKRWRILRRHQLFIEPLCECGAIATDADHITPIEQGGAPWSQANLQSLCGPCHSQKTRREQLTKGATTVNNGDKVEGDKIVEAPVEGDQVEGDKVEDNGDENDEG